jgi:hypothetical protein
MLMRCALQGLFMVQVIDFMKSHGYPQSTLMNQRTSYSWKKSSRPVIIPLHLVHDIDTPDNWLQTELKFAALSSSHYE